MKTYRLGSSQLVSAPGIIRWAINGYAFPEDREAMTNIVSDTWKIPTEATEKLLSGETNYEIDGEAVVFKA